MFGYPTSSATSGTGRHIARTPSHIEKWRNSLNRTMTVIAAFEKGVDAGPQRRRFLSLNVSIRGQAALGIEVMAAQAIWKATLLLGDAGSNGRFSITRMTNF
jgi:hypothetical protein